MSSFDNNNTNDLPKITTTDTTMNNIQIENLTDPMAAAPKVSIAQPTILMTTFDEHDDDHMNASSSQPQQHNSNEYYYHQKESPRIILPTQTTFRSTILMDEFNENENEIERHAGNKGISNYENEFYNNYSSTTTTMKKDLNLNDTFYSFSYSMNHTSTSTNTVNGSCTTAINKAMELPALSNLSSISSSKLLPPIVTTPSNAAATSLEKEHSPMHLDDCPPMLESLFTFYSLSSPSHLFLTIIDFCNSSFDDFDIAIEKDRVHGRLRGIITERISSSVLLSSIRNTTTVHDEQNTNATPNNNRSSQDFTSQFMNSPFNFALSKCTFEISLFNAPSISCPHQIACEIQCRSGDRDLFSQFFNLLTNHLSDCIHDRTHLPQLSSTLPPFISSSSSPSYSLSSSTSSLPILSSMSSSSNLLPSYDDEFELDLLVFKQFHAASNNNNRTAVNVDV